MQCPRCQDSTLARTLISTQKIQLLQCGQCKGYWSKPEAFRPIMTNASIDLFIIPAHAFAAQDTPCPECQCDLYEYCYPNTDILIDGCKSCQGLWLDHQEIHKIIKAQRNRVAIQCPRCQQINTVNKDELTFSSCSSCNSLLHKDTTTHTTSDRHTKTQSTNVQHEDKMTPDTDRMQITYEWEEVPNKKTEYQFCLYALPSMLFLAVLFNVSGLGSHIQRIWLTMPVHELGHALTAWFTGYNAIPSLWVTRIYSDSKGLFCPLLLLACIVFMARYAMLKNHIFGLSLCIGLFLLQCIGTFTLSTSTHEMLFSFGGDGMGLIIATALMSSFYYGKQTNLYKGALRWGFLAIGAAAFVDIYSVWFYSLNDLGKVPYGTTGGRFTDSYKLIEHHGWTFDQLINRYLTVGNSCLVCLTLNYFIGLKKAKRMII